MRKPPTIVERQPETPVRIGFTAFFGEHFRVTRGAWAWGVLLSILAAPVLSLLKPSIGVRGMVLVLLVIAVVSCTCFTAYFAARLASYFLFRQRAVNENATSWLAPIGYTGMMCAIPLLAFVCVEYVSPPAGLLATIVPELKVEQARWLPTFDGAVRSIQTQLRTGTATSSKIDATRPAEQDETAEFNNADPTSKP